MRSLHGLQVKEGLFLSSSKEHYCFCQFWDTFVEMTSSWSPDFSVGDSGRCGLKCSLQLYILLLNLGPNFNHRLPYSFRRQDSIYILPSFYNFPWVSKWLTYICSFSPSKVPRQTSNQIHHLYNDHFHIPFKYWASEQLSASPFTYTSSQPRTQRTLETMICRSIQRISFTLLATSHLISKTFPEAHSNCLISRASSGTKCLTLVSPLSRTSTKTWVQIVYLWGDSRKEE